jgi:GTPase involved in cell partitioning and DNA repair
MYGKAGEDKTITVPVGTVVTTSIPTRSSAT